MNGTSKPGLTRRRVGSSLGRSADTPHGVDHPVQRLRSERKPLKRSIYFGFLMYILRVEFDQLTREQQHWIVSFAQKCSDEELFRAGKLAFALLSDEKIRLFHARDIQRVRRSIPWLERFQSPEAVRIGKGYTDKGALRPYHERGRSLSQIKFWDADIVFMLPFDYQVKGDWLTADEASSLVGESLFELVLNQLRQGTANWSNVSNCRYT